MLADERCAGACVAQDVRADATPFTRLDHHLAFSADRSQLAEGQHWLSMVTSMIRRSVWERIPFDERVTYAEDAVWSHAIINAGWTTRFIADRSAEHSHNYTWSQRYRRAYGDSAAFGGYSRKPARAHCDWRCFKAFGTPLAQRWVVLLQTWPPVIGSLGAVVQFCRSCMAPGREPAMAGKLFTVHSSSKRSPFMRKAA